jgi:hypothetical protein
MPTEWTDAPAKLQQTAAGRHTAFTANKSALELYEPKVWNFPLQGSDEGR